MKTSQLVIKAIKYIFIAILLAFFALIIILATSYRDLKNVAAQALSGKNSLESAVSYASARNWQASQLEVEEANREIKDSLQLVNKVKSKKIFSNISILNNQMLDLEYLLNTVALISDSLDSALPIAEKLDGLYIESVDHSFASLPTPQKREFFQILHESEPEINGIRANLKLAEINLDKIRRIGVLYPIYSQITDIKTEIEGVNSILVKTAPLMRLLPVLAGYPSASEYLIIMHNNDELRPSGGFIGVYGLLKTENGEIIHLQTSDSYHLDMPTVGKWTMEPPAPISKYMSVKNWYFRDANWSPNWPTSAQKLIEFYEGEKRVVGESSPKFTGVIGITPRFVSDLLELVGPIEIDGDLYTPDNLQELLQYSVEVAYLEEGIPEWDRKEVINELLDELKNRLLNLETSRLVELLDILEDNAEKKDLQIYFNNTLWQQLSKEINASGEVIKTENDYLLVVDANLAAFKSDSVMRKGINYEVMFRDNKASSVLNLEYKHQGGFDWRTTRYRSYTRVYVPRGSTLNSIRATGKTNLEAASITTYDDVNLDKTVFAFFFQLEPGTEGTINLDYSLPSYIATNWSTKNYALDVQKQAGRRTNSFTAVINGNTYQRSLDTDILILP